MTMSELKGKAQTVLGPIDPTELGNTLMHEHLVWDIRTPKMAADLDQGPEINLCNCWQFNYGRVKVPRNFISRSAELATFEVKEMVAAGGNTIVELSSGGLAPAPNALAQISRDSGAHVVMGCGHYVDEYQDEANHSRGVDSFATEIVGQILEGAWDTNIRAGMIGEIGCQSPWTNLEKRVMAGAIIAQQETGASLNVHPGRHEEQPQEIMEFIVAHDGAPERTVISHIERTIFDFDRLFRLADTGCIIEFDLFGQETSYYPLNPQIDMPNDAIRLRLIRALIERGHLDQIVISHDICFLTRLRSYGGHGYGHIFENAIPLMRLRDFTETEIQAIIVDTPRRLLTFV
jgi:phosphotriesterase-related protein